MKNPKTPENCTVFKIFSLLSDAEQKENLKRQYLAGGLGYGDAKQTLFELVLEKFKTEREKYAYYQEYPQEVEVALAKGAVKASKIADDVLLRVRRKIGFRPIKKSCLKVYISLKFFFFYKIRIIQIGKVDNMAMFHKNSIYKGLKSWGCKRILQDSMGLIFHPHYN